MKGQPTLHTSLCKTDFLIFFHMTTDNRTRETVTTLELLKLRVGYF